MASPEQQEARKDRLHPNRIIFAYIKQVLGESTERPGSDYKSVRYTEVFLPMPNYIKSIELRWYDKAPSLDSFDMYPSDVATAMYERWSRERVVIEINFSGTSIDSNGLHTDNIFPQNFMILRDSEGNESYYYRTGLQIGYFDDGSIDYDARGLDYFDIRHHRGDYTGEGFQRCDTYLEVAGNPEAKKEMGLMPANPSPNNKEYALAPQKSIWIEFITAVVSQLHEWDPNRFPEFINFMKEFRKREKDSPDLLTEN